MVDVPAFNAKAIEVCATALPQELHSHCRAAMDYWREKSRALPRRPDELFHCALIELMDSELNLFDRGPERFSVPLQAVGIARNPAEVTGFVQYNHVVRCWVYPGPARVPLSNLFAGQAAVHAAVPQKVHRTSLEECSPLWAGLDK